MAGKRSIKVVSKQEDETGAAIMYKVTGRVECMSDQVAGMPLIPMEQLVDLSLSNLLQGFRPA